MLPEALPQPYNLHFQETTVTQAHPPFHAPYSGRNSLTPNAEFATTVTSTLYGGLRTWKGAEVFLNPELSGGQGIGSTLGVAGFPNGEAFRVNDPVPAIYVARLFLRQTFELGGAEQSIESEPNQLAGTRDSRRVSLVVGKFSTADLFDNNLYSHDPRTQFLNWSLMDSGSW